VSKFADDAEVPSFAKKVVCAKCGARGRHIDVRPNWKRTAAAREPDREGVAMSGAILADAIFAIVFSIVMVTFARFLWALMY
jgi:hypothetical protein